MAVSAFVLMDVTGDHTKSAYKTITRIEGVKSIYEVTGPYDLIARTEADTIEQLHDVLARIRAVDGLLKTSTAIVINPSPLRA